MQQGDTKWGERGREQGLTAEGLLRLLVQVGHGNASGKKCIVGVLDRERGSSLGRKRVELRRRDSGVDTPNHGLCDEHLQTQRKGWVRVRNTNIAPRYSTAASSGA